MDHSTRRAATVAVGLLTALSFGPGAVAQTSGRGRPAAPAAAPATPAPGARPAAAPVAPVLPEPPIPTQHANQAGMGRCVPAIDQLARSALGVPYNAQSIWNQAHPAEHVFQSVAGLKNPKNNPSGGMVALIGAPVGNEGCDAVAVEVYPLAGTCAEVQRVMAKGGEVETSLEDIKVISDPQKRRLFLMPGFGNSCIAVSVNSFFGPP